MPLLTEADIRHRIGQELQRATTDRHHEWRTPVMATVGADHTPQARTVVLRQADTPVSTLQIFTDSRSPKVAELTASPLATVQRTGAEVDAVWMRVSQSAAAGDYLSAHAPGAALSMPTGDATAGQEAPPTHHLALITLQVQDMDWLELARSGHRRAVFSAERWEWRVP